MCGCVEHMPVVSRSDCTQTNVQEYYTFYKNADTTGFTAIMDGVKLQFQSCQGANNRNNDLSAFVQQLVNDEKLSTNEQDIYNTRVVGNRNCPSAIGAKLNEAGFQNGFNIDESEWTFIIGENFGNEQPDLVHFQEMFDAQDIPIVRRVCPTCVTSHKDIYYRRFTPIPEGFDLLDTLMNNWFEADNVLNVDFGLYSTQLDAYYDTNRWSFCNYDDPGIGFPRDCGPKGKVNHQWNSYVRGGGHAHHHAFLIQTDPDFKPKISHENVALFKPTYQSSVYGNDVYPSSNAVNGDKSENAVISHSGLMQDPWWSVHLQGLYTISKIVVFNRRNCCQERLSGFQVDIISSDGTVFTFNHDPTQGSPGTVILINIPAGIIGDRVKLSLPGKKDYINILEVEVHGDLSAEFNSTNVALNKPTLHSSIYSKDYDSPNAVDGNLESLFHTGNMENNWLRVNLEDLYAIREIIIFNRRRELARDDLARQDPVRFIANEVMKCRAQYDARPWGK